MANQHLMGGSNVATNTSEVNFEDGTIQTTAGYPAASIQSGHQAYVPTATDVTNGYANVPIVFPTPFTNASYTVEVSLSLEGNIPSWVPNTPYDTTDAILDSHGMLETVAIAGTSGATEPTWPTANNTRTDEGPSVPQLEWYMSVVNAYNAVSAVKARTETGFIVEVVINNAPPVVPFTLHWLAVEAT